MMFTDLRLTRPLKIVLLFSFTMLAATFATHGNAAAYPWKHGDLDAYAPSYVGNAIIDECNRPDFTVAQTQWIAPANNPTATSMTVPYNTTSVDLMFYSITIRCRDSAPVRVKGTFVIDEVNPFIRELHDPSAPKPYDFLRADMPYPNPGDFYSANRQLITPFKFNGPFVNSGTYGITVKTRGTVTRYDTNSGAYSYRCAVTDTQTQDYPKGQFQQSNIDFTNCNSTTSTFSLQIIVGAPQATVNGAKIASSSSGAYGGACASVPAGVDGNCGGAISDYPFSDDGVTIAGIPTNSNAFTIPNVTSGNQSFNLDTGQTANGEWTYKGYGFCDQSDPGCTDGSVLPGGSNYHSVNAGYAIPNQNFESGKSYKLRLLYSATPGLDSGVSCVNGFNGNASSPTASGAATISIYADGDKGTSSVTGSLTGIRTNSAGDYSIPFDNLRKGGSGTYRDGKDHTFYVYAAFNGGSTVKTVQTMEGCVKYGLTPTAQGNLVTNPDGSVEFQAHTEVAVTYFNLATPTKPPVPGEDVNEVTHNGGTAGLPPVTGDQLVNRPATYGSSPTTRDYRMPLSFYSAGDKYCIKITAKYRSGIVSRSGVILVSYFPDETSATSCDTLQNTPFLKVLQSGIRSGGDFYNKNNSCSSDGILAGFANNLYENAFGSSAQYGVIAKSTTTGVLSSQNQYGVGSSVDPTRLSFANNSVASPGSIAVSQDGESPKLGGAFGGSHCLYDPELPAGTVTDNGNKQVINNGLKESKHFTSPSVELKAAGGGLEPKTHVYLYADGDIYITDNIAYKLNGWSLTNKKGDSNVPNLIIKAKGNIYIDRDVTNLDGTYISEGTIYTCAEKKGGPDKTAAPITLSNVYNDCNKQLVVHGSFVATTVNLMRTLGTVSSDQTLNRAVTAPCANPNAAQRPNDLTTCAGEVFDFSPEMYLSQPAIKGSNDGTARYDAISSPPPVL